LPEASKNRVMKTDKKEQKKVDDWNRKYPVGQKVIVKKDDGTEIETFTNCYAELLEGFPYGEYECKCGEFSVRTGPKTQ